MNMRWILAASLLAAAPAPVAFSATPAGPSFDCARAATPVEKAICANPGLAKLDRDMAAAYAAAASVTPTPVTLKTAQRDFLAERNRGDDGQPAKTVSVEGLTLRYQLRTEQLNAEVANAKRAATVRLSAADLGKRCAVIAVDPCKVEASGKVAGSGPYGGLFYQLQGPASEDDYTHGSVILKPDPSGALRPLLWSFQGEHLRAPEIVQSPAGPLLALPSNEGGTGVFNADLVFRPVEGGWRDLEIDAWRAAFNKKLPAGVGVWKGVLYDWKTLTMETLLWADTDANCCPTGGSAKAAFAVQGDRLTLKSMSVDRTPPRDE